MQRVLPAQEEKPKPRRAIQLLLVGLAYFGLTTLFTFPLILNFTSALPGQLLEDRDQNLWNLWWVKESILHLKNPFHTDFIYFPDGVSLYFHTLNPLNGLISLPVQLVFGTLVAYNFVVFFSFIMAGLGSYLLLLHLTGHPAAAFCASLIFVFAPYHLGTLKGIMQLISLEWLPFYILFLLKATLHPLNVPWRKRWPNIAAATLCLIFTALTDWYYTIFLIMFTLIYLAGRLVMEPLVNSLRRHLRRDHSASTDPNSVKNDTLLLHIDQSFRVSPFVEANLTGIEIGLQAQAGRWRRLLVNVLMPVVLIGVFFLLLISPILMAMFREMSATTYYLPDPNDTRNYSADLLALFFPSTTSTFFGGFGANILTAHDLIGPLAAQVFLGYFPLGFAALGLIVSRRSRFWGISGLLFAVLALGPALRINGPQPGWWMPYALIEDLPVIKIMRSPDRFIVITMLCLAVCAGFGLRYLFERLPKLSLFSLIRINFLSGRRRKFDRTRQFILPSIACCLIIAEFLQIPYPVNTYQVSPFFVHLGQDQADYSLLELPPQAGYWSGADRMAEQVVHHKRIFDGYISREYDHPFQRNTPGFSDLTTLNFGKDIVLPNQANPQQPVALQSWYDAFSYYKVRYIILRLPSNTKQTGSVDLDKYRAAIALVAPGPPAYKDNQIEAYALPQASAKGRHPFIEITGNNWYAPEPSVVAPGSFYRWSSGSTSLSLLWEGPANLNGEFSLTLGSLEGTKPAQISFDGTMVWSGTLTPDLQQIKIPLKVSPGKHQINIEVQGKARRPVSLGIGGDTRALLYNVSDISFK